MYYFKKLSLANRKLKLVKQIGKINIKIKKLTIQGEYLFGREIKLLREKINNKNSEIIVINEILEYLQKEKPKPSQKVSNNSFIAAAKNDSGAKIQLPSLPKNED